MDQLSDVHNRYEAQTSINQVDLKTQLFSLMHVHVRGLIFMHAGEMCFDSMLPVRVRSVRIEIIICV